MRLTCSSFIALAVTLVAMMTTVRADDVPGVRERLAAEQKAAWEAASTTLVKGPASVDLGSQARLAVPDGMAYIPREPGIRIMRAMGNSVSDDFRGLAVGRDNWLATIDYRGEGFVKDDDAKNWDVDGLLKSLTEGTEAGNEDRRSRGFPGLIIDGWIERPSYDASAHTLIWSVRAHEEGETDPTRQSVNYNTYLLGREGYLSLDFITGADTIEAEKPLAHTLLAGLSFVDGKRYQDYVAGTDHLAAYGLAALIGGLAAKKLGLLALAGVFIAKFAKLGLILLAGGAVAVRRFFGRFFRRGDPS
jgi:uncharacterized membrane-anchored protein